MKRAVRGSTVTLVVRDLLDRNGDAATPTSIQVYLDYPDACRTRSQANYSMTNAAGVWTYDWDSSVAYPGTVSWSIRAAGDDNFAADAEFQLTGNAANPNP